MSKTETETETIVMSVGGSLIVPDQLDTNFLRALRDLIVTETASNRRFILIAGGGRTSRRYVDAATKVTTLTNDDMDWLGIHATRLNGHLLRTIFRDIAHPVMVTNPDDVLDVPTKAALIIGAGYRPGSSSDLRAVQIATLVDAHKLINLSNIDHVYTADPRIDKTATPITDINWEEFRNLIPKEWGPNLSAPFDPVAAKTASEQKLEVAVINGADLASVRDYLNGQPFTGTRIHA